ncbi:hypothetical protein SAMN05444714_0180 [Yoonia litorea]|uniref:Uncharacterized protein n=1 Tax=Yoonia litorea TaxID=1123755 RepID=A0A1I6L4T4_9RHOB|nr:hypothetical protein SAMN05444714_0180 [Yoonia litorea]
MGGLGHPMKEIEEPLQTFRLSRLVRAKLHQSAHFILSIAKKTRELDQKKAFKRCLLSRAYETPIAP